MDAKQVVCDTDVIINYFDVSSFRHLQCCKILEQEIGLDNIIWSAITLMELISGARNKIKKKIARFKLALLSPEITSEAILFFEKYRLSHSLAIPDCLIASTAVVLDIPLLTFNIKDYQFIDSVKLYQTKLK